jgi:hypothetical protein
LIPITAAGHGTREEHQQNHMKEISQDLNLAKSLMEWNI